MDEAKSAVSILHEAIKGRQEAEANLTEVLAKYSLARIKNATDANDVSAILSQFQDQVLSW